VAHAPLSTLQSPSRKIENNIPVKNYDNTAAVYIPFASSNVITFYLQGKEMNSFIVKEPSWKIFPNSSAKNKMGVVQIISNNGEKIHLA
jgi:hypothetical protein